MNERLIKLRPIKKSDTNIDKPADDSEDKQLSIKVDIENAYKELREVKEQQETLIEQTKAEVIEAKENWETEKQQYINQAQEEGYKKGFDLGKQESINQYKTLLTEANNIVKSATTDYHATIEQSDETILELAIRVAEKIIKKELRENPELFNSIVSTAIKEIKDQSSLTIYVHPSNYELVIQQKDEIDRLVGKDINVSVYINEDLNEDSCLIEHPFGRIDASVDTQLQELRRILLEVSMENSQ